MYDILYFLAGAILGVIATFLLMSARFRASLAANEASAKTEVSALRADFARIEGRSGELERQLGERTTEIAGLNELLREQQQARAAAEARQDESARNIESQRKLLDEAQTKLREAFTALSAEALRANNETFAAAAAERVKPLAEALDRYERHIQQIEHSRQKAYGELSERLSQLGLTSARLSEQTSSLVTALRTPQVKGRWGELALRNAVQLAGMTDYCDFLEQVSVETDTGRIRPDMTIRLPGGRTIVVDSKTPTAAYLDAVQAGDEAARGAALARHAAAVRTHVQRLGAMEYWRQFNPAPEFVVLFIPGECFFSAALEQDATLMEDAVQKRVILASPTTLIALLRAVAFGWQQQRMVENARQIGDTARELYDRVAKFAEHLADIGKQLDRTSAAFNRATGSWQSRLLPMGRKLDELGGSTTQGEFPDIAQVETPVRELPSERDVA
ncbi:MAG: DNA recombination protein RmuC [Phycisphaerales bacterium]|nr:DNA recombination protein RmuC [Phycisphaerales bacterium]